MVDSDVFQTLLMTTLAVLLLLVPIEIRGVEFSLFFVPLLLVRSRLLFKMGAAVAVYLFYHLILGYEWQIYVIFSVLYLVTMTILPFIRVMRTRVMLILNVVFSALLLLGVHLFVHELTIAQTITFLLMSMIVMAVSNMTYEDINSITKLMKRYEEDTYKDHLTQLGNIRSLDTFVDDLNEHAETLSVLLIDIDNFKVINDEHTYLAGDALIKQVAHLLENHVPTGGRLFRNNGEEFSIIIPDISLDKTVRLGEAVRLSVEKAKFHIDDVSQETVQLTVSIGVGFKGSDKTLGRLFKDADDMLHAAKKMGQNQVMFYPVIKK
ncbi:GGDEF domain-containing protein [Corticicoccus populi]|uniref:GGDEF domain-containing protein n=1 Tax=Corticicoccus populi TaxID=1812821 RepID=A0ABW5WV30_9STAP